MPIHKHLRQRCVSSFQKICPEDAPSSSGLVLDKRLDVVTPENEDFDCPSSASAESCNDQSLVTQSSSPGSPDVNTDDMKNSSVETLTCDDEVPVTPGTHVRKYFVRSGWLDGYVTHYSKELDSYILAFPRECAPSKVYCGKKEGYSLGEVQLMIRLAAVKEGMRLGIFWEEDDCFYSATVVELFHRQQKNCRLEYDDGVFEWIDLAQHAFQVLESPENSLGETAAADCEVEGENCSEMEKVFSGTESDAGDIFDEFCGDDCELSRLSHVDSVAFVRKGKASCESTEDGNCEEEHESNVEMKMDEVSNSDRTAGDQCVNLTEDPLRSSAAEIKKEEGFRVNESENYDIFDEFGPGECKSLNDSCINADSVRSSPCWCGNEAEQMSPCLDQIKELPSRKCDNELTVNHRVKQYIVGNMTKRRQSQSLDQTMECSIKECGESAGAERGNVVQHSSSVSTATDVAFRMREKVDIVKIGTRLAVFWPGESKYYSGTVTRARDMQIQRVYIEYDDGDSEWIDLGEHEYRLLKRGRPRKTDASRNKEPATATSSKKRKIVSVGKTPEVEYDMDDLSKIKVGSKVKVWWKDDRRFYEGRVTMERVHAKPFHLEYVDGEKEWIDFRQHKFRLIPTRGCVEESNCEPLELGSRLDVWWPTEKKFYRCTLTRRRDHVKAHYLEYDDGDKEWIDLTKSRYRVLSGPQLRSQVGRYPGRHS